MGFYYTDEYIVQMEYSQFGEYGSLNGRILELVMPFTFTTDNIAGISNGLWISGNNIDQQTVEVCYFFQLDGSTINRAYVTCYGGIPFYVPAIGRMSDAVDLSNFNAGPGYFRIHTKDERVYKPIEPIDITVGNTTPSTPSTEPAVEPPMTPPYNGGIQYEVQPPSVVSKSFFGSASSSDGEVVVACSAADYLYNEDGGALTLTKKGGVFISLDGGDTWKDITPQQYNGFLWPVISCDSTGTHIVLVTQYMPFSEDKSGRWKLTSHHSGCILVSHNRGVSWEAHWPGFDYVPGPYYAQDVVTPPDVMPYDFHIGTGYEISFVNSIANADYDLDVYGYVGEDVVARGRMSQSYSGYTLTYISDTLHGFVYGYEQPAVVCSEWFIEWRSARRGYTDITISNNGDTILAAFIANSEEAGLLLSVNGGTTWSMPIPTSSCQLEKVQISADGTYIVGTDGTCDRWASINGGTTFTKYTNAALEVRNICITGDGSIVYQLDYAGAVSTLYRSPVTNLDSLTALPVSGLPVEIATAKVFTDYDGSSIVILGGIISEALLYATVTVSTDFGVTWNNIVIEQVSTTDPYESQVFYANISITSDGRFAYVPSFNSKELLKIDLFKLTVEDITPVSRSMNTATCHCVGTITITDNTKLTAGETITIAGIVYTFVAFFSGADNELIIGSDANRTAAYMAVSLSDAYGSSIIATFSTNTVVVDYLTDTLIEWSTTSDGISLDELILSCEYTYATSPATFTGLISSGYISDSGVGALLPALTSAGTVTQTDFVIPYNTLPSLSAAGHVYNDSIDSTATDAEKIALLSCDNDWIAAYAERLTVTGTNDENVLLLVQYVGYYLTYVADSVDKWKDPQQTIADGFGDCEDGSILLFSLMVNYGIPSSRVRVYTGTFAGIGHAWVSYLRESDNAWITLDWTLGSLWAFVSSLNQVPKTYLDDYYLYEIAYSYFSCGTYTDVDSLEEYIASIVGISTNELEYPEYVIEATMDNHLSGEIEYPEYEVDGYTGATTYSEEPYAELDYPDYTVEATGYGNSIGHNIAFDYPDYTITGSMTSGNLLYTEEDNLDYPDYEVAGTMYVVASMNVSLTYPIHVINLHCLEAISSVPVEWDGTEPHTAIRLNTVNFAASRYSNFRFNSMCNFMGEIICANSSGIFRHTGDTDNGVDIDAYFQLPSADYSTHKAKSYRKIYLEGYLEGEITVTTVVDDVYGSQLNIASLGTEAEVQHVFERQRDDRGNLIGLRVANNDGKDFTIHSIYATLIASSTLPNGYTGLGRVKFEYPTYEVSASAS